MLTDRRDPRQVIRDLVESVRPLDDQEATDQQWMLDWVDSGAPLFRTAKPATPPKHLAVYAALLDEAASRLMLVDHAKARAWLMPGGHVDEGEDPSACVTRELVEELNIRPEFHPRFGSDPFFLTITRTRPPYTHTDVTMWFVFTVDEREPIVPDLAEFSEVRWFTLGDSREWRGYDFDPQMHRFLSKLSRAFELVPTG